MLLYLIFLGLYNISSVSCFHFHLLLAGGTCLGVPAVPLMFWITQTQINNKSLLHLCEIIVRDWTETAGLEPSVCVEKLQINSKVAPVWRNCCPVLKNLQDIVKAIGVSLIYILSSLLLCMWRRGQTHCLTEHLSSLGLWDVLHSVLGTQFAAAECGCLEALRTNTKYFKLI